jgi:guanylate kinase
LEAWRGKTVSVFILPPSREELERRLDGRASETAESKRMRLTSAQAEMARIDEYDYVVVNGDLEQALKELKAIRTAEHCRAGRRDGWK